MPGQITSQALTNLVCKMSSNVQIPKETVLNIVHKLDSDQIQIAHRQIAIMMDFPSKLNIELLNSLAEQIAELPAITTNFTADVECFYDLRDTKDQTVDAT